MLPNLLNLRKLASEYTDYNKVSETLTTTKSEAFVIIFQNFERTMTFQKILKGQAQPLSLESGKRKRKGFMN